MPSFADLLFKVIRWVAVLALLLGVLVILNERAEHDRMFDTGPPEVETDDG